MRTRDLTYIGVYLAIIIAAQFALSFVSGVELVTVLVASFCYRFGLKRSLVLVNAFCILRCVIFGFFPTVVILYLVYFNLFAVGFSAVGRLHKRRLTAPAAIHATAFAVVMTALFTLFDDVLTPLFYRFTREAAVAYFNASLITMAAQCTCALISMALLFSPVVSALASIDRPKANAKLSPQRNEL